MAFPIFLLLVGLTGNVSGLITIYKPERSTNSQSQILVKTIDDESIWPTSSKKSDHVQNVNRTIEKAFLYVQSYESELCTSKIKPSPNSKVPWVVLASADTKLCSNARQLTVTQNAGYAGLILYATKSLWSSFMPSDHGQEFEQKLSNIPVFFVNAEDGQYLKEKFGYDQYEIRHFIRLDKHISWRSRAVKFLSPVYKILKAFCEIAVAFVIVLWELLMKWIYTAFHVIDKFGIVSFIVLCLPVIILIFAACIAKARIPHPFFGYHFSDYAQDYQDFYGDGASDQEDSDGGRGDYDRSAKLLQHFNTLGIPPGSNFDIARAAYINLSKQYHPDKSEGLSDGQITRNTEKMKELTAAWRELKVHLSPPSAD